MMCPPQAQVVLVLIIGGLAHPQTAAPQVGTPKAKPSKSDGQSFMAPSGGSSMELPLLGPAPSPYGQGTREVLAGSCWPSLFCLKPFWCHQGWFFLQKMFTPQFLAM